MVEKNDTLLVYLLSKSINKYVGIFRLSHKKLKVWWQKIPKKLSEHARLLETSEYTGFSLFYFFDLAPLCSACYCCRKQQAG